MSLPHPGLLALVVCTLALNCPATLVAQNASSRDPDHGGNRESRVQPIALEELPDSPGALWAQSQIPAEQNSPAQPSDPQSQPQAPDQSTNQNEKLQRPVGTAAAEAPKVSGVTAAQPAGAAIAPAKQRRVRTIVLKVGAILGAGAAVGTVIALSAATPSKPPGAH
jgi:hypothetical protein